jgi:hypothetical protein
MAEIVLYGTSAIIGSCFIFYSYRTVVTNKEKNKNEEFKKKNELFDIKKKEIDENVNKYKKYIIQEEKILDEYPNICIEERKNIARKIVEVDSFW